MPRRADGLKAKRPALDHIAADLSAPLHGGTSTRHLPHASLPNALDGAREHPPSENGASPHPIDRPSVHAAAAAPLRPVAVEDPTTISLAGLPVRNTRTERLTRFLLRRLESRRKIAIGFVNQNFVIHCHDLPRGTCADDSVMLVNDGVGMQIAARLRHGRSFLENLNGTDFVPHFLQHAGRPLLVYLVGSAPVVVARAATVIDTWPNCHVVGRCDGFSLWAREKEILAEISERKPDVLLVGLGNPLQEQWVLRHWDELDAGVVFGVGALFEWMSGYRQRAPKIIRRLRLEWVYRLALEPRRLGYRYTVGILKFFALVLAAPAAPRRDAAS